MTNKRKLNIEYIISTIYFLALLVLIFIDVNIKLVLLDAVLFIRSAIIIGVLEIKEFIEPSPDEDNLDDDE